MNTITIRRRYLRTRTGRAFISDLLARGYSLRIR